MVCLDAGFGNKGSSIAAVTLIKLSRPVPGPIKPQKQSQAFDSQGFFRKSNVKR
jgi:hypothetical protein